MPLAARARASSPAATVSWTGPRRSMAARTARSAARSPCTSEKIATVSAAPGRAGAGSGTGDVMVLRDPLPQGFLVSRLDPGGNRGLGEVGGVARDRPVREANQREVVDSPVRDQLPVGGVCPQLLH